MKRLLIALTAGLFAVTTAHAGDLWLVTPGSYSGSNRDDVAALYHTPHGTNQYRALRDSLISGGTLFRLPNRGIVEAIGYSDGIAMLVDDYGDIFWIPTEDFKTFLGSR